MAAAGTSRACVAHRRRRRQWLPSEALVELVGRGGRERRIEKRIVLWKQVNVVTTAALCAPSISRTTPAPSRMNAVMVKVPEKRRYRVRRVKCRDSRTAVEEAPILTAYPVLSSM